MKETGSRPGTGMTSPRPYPSHQAVMDRLRQRFSQYRKHHIDCQSKYVQSLPAVQDLERQEASNLHKRALECRNRMMNMNGKASKQNDGEGKVEQQQQMPNGLEKSTNAIFQIREVCFLCCTKGLFCVESISTDVLIDGYYDLLLTVPNCLVYVSRKTRVAFHILN